MFTCLFVCLLLFSQISASDVCGCPLVTNVFEETGDFCRASKRRCLKHYCWEKLRRAEIDLQRIQQVEVSSIYGPGVGWELVAELLVHSISSSPGSNPGHGRRVIFLGETAYSHVDFSFCFVWWGNQ